MIFKYISPELNSLEDAKRYSQLLKSYGIRELPTVMFDSDDPIVVEYWVTTKAFCVSNAGVFKTDSTTVVGFNELAYILKERGSKC